MMDLQSGVVAFRGFFLFSDAKQFVFLTVVMHHINVFMRFLCSDRIRYMTRGSNLPAVVLSHA